MCHSGGESKRDDGCAGELTRHFRFRSKAPLWDAMDATASGAQGIAGRVSRERSAGARRTALQPVFGARGDDAMM
jgi:hypothetical protein